MTVIPLRSRISCWHIDASRRAAAPFMTSCLEPHTIKNIDCVDPCFCRVLTPHNISKHLPFHARLMYPHDFFGPILTSKIIKHQPNSNKQEISEVRDLMSDVLSRACKLIAGEQLMALPCTNKDEDDGCLLTGLISCMASKSSRLRRSNCTSATASTCAVPRGALFSSSHSGSGGGKY
jgi:hypothetical protein